MLQKKIIGLIERIESCKRGIVFWFFLFYGITIVRTITESLIGGLRRFPRPLTLLVHFPLFYFNFFISIAFILWFFTGEKIHKTTRATLSFCFLIIVVPLVDFLIFGSTFHYRYPMTVDAILNEVFALGGLLPGSVLLPGQAVAIWTAIFLISIYVMLKTRDGVKAVAASVSFYFTGVFFSAFPFFATSIFSLGNNFNPNVMIAGIAFFLISAFLLCIFWIYIYNKKLLAELFSGLRPLRTWHYLNLVVIGWVLALFLFPEKEPVFLGLLLALFSVFTAFEACLLCNNIYDNALKEKKAKKQGGIVFTLAIFSLASAFFAGIETFSIIFFSLVIGLYYSMPPFRLKRLGFLNNTVIGFLSMLVFLTGFLSYVQNLSAVPITAAIAVLVTFSLAANIKDLKDFETDKKEGIKTLPVLLGKKKGLKAVAFLSSIAFPVPALFLGFLEIAAVGVAFGALNYLLLSKTGTERATFVLYAVYAVLFAAMILS